MYLGLDLNQWFVLENTDRSEEKQLFPTPCTIRSALTYFTDLNGAPSRSLLERLSKFATMPEHRARLVQLASKEGKDEFQRYVTERKMCVAEIFETYPSFKLNESNLGPFFEVMPRLKGREFTISSSALVQPTRVAITVGVIQEDKPGEPSGRVLKGVASTYLKEVCTLGALPHVFVKESTFKMPAEASVPIILIGPGTGIAPMRAFLQERKHQIATLGRAKVGESVLFFGCRREDEDFIYKDELLQYVRDGVLSKLHTAFSRQHAQKVYVQHLLDKEKKNVWALLSKGAHVYVCGATGMGKDVHTTLTNICLEEGKMQSLDQAKDLIKQLQQSGRYIQELWSS
jgi:NADPH-ferrihemoprotein reductase